jgi:hypothetical protein
MGSSVKKAARIVIVFCKLHRFVIFQRLERGDRNGTEDLQPDADNCVVGELQAYSR